ncbi:MAG TPA: hypothetical protein VLT85_09320 [Terriglobales bacterium]|nr:hypothetical protein [Terriglobales bacterium]
MKRSCSAVLLVAFLWGLSAFADSKKKDRDSVPAAPLPMSEPTKVAILQSLAAERVYVRKPFPRGKKGLVLSATGVITPDDGGVAQLIADHGLAAKPGDMAVITKIDFRDDSIVFEINGGPKKGGHWYQHLQLGMGGGMTSVAPPNTSENALGSYVELKFPKYVPELNPHEIRSLLDPVFDFNSHSSAEALAETLPPKLREAIKAHHVLVGMDHQMVIAALGKPLHKVREKDAYGVDYEEWIFGEPPQDVQFVRFIGEVVVRLEIMKVDGSKIVRTEPEVEGYSRPAQAAGQAPASQGPPPEPPTLRRPGEAPPDNTPQPPGGPVLMPQDTGPGASPSPGAPNSPNPGNGPVPPPPPPGGPN